MNLKNYIVILIVFLSVHISLYGQGKVDTDPILSTISWNAWKIDKDETIKYTLSSTLSQNGKQDILALYSKSNSLCKIIRIEGYDKGTQMTTYYFIDSVPVLIVIKRNPYVFTVDGKQFIKTVASFQDKVDTSAAQIQPIYPIQYNASYYYKNGRLYYSNVSENNILRVDNPLDKRMALLSYAEAKQFFERYSVYTDNSGK